MWAILEGLSAHPWGFSRGAAGRMHCRGVKNLSQRVTARGGAGGALALRGQGMGKEQHHEAGTGLSLASSHP